MSTCCTCQPGSARLLVVKIMCADAMCKFPHPPTPRSALLYFAAASVLCMCVCAWESVFCGGSGSLFKPMRVHYCDPSPSLLVPALTYCGVCAAIFSLGFVRVFEGNLSSYVFFYYYVNRPLFFYPQ